MRIAHLADTHLGVRRFHAINRAGANVIEADVARSFTAAIDGVIARAPDLVVVAGDVFDTVRPSNAALVLAVQQFRRLVEALPATPVVVIGGNHEIPLSTDVRCVLEALTPLGVHVVFRAAEWLRFPDRDLSVLCVPERPDLVRPALVPDPASRWNVLLLHGEVRGVIPGTHRDLHDISRPGDAPWEATDLATAWDYVALGHYHVATEVAPRVWYAGSLDNVSSDPWGEIRGNPFKGWALHDCATGTHELISTPGLRPWLDLPPIDGAAKSAAEIDALLAAAVAAVGGVEGKVARMKVTDIPREVQRDLDHAQLRRWKSTATNLNITFTAPERTRLFGGTATRARQTLDELLAERITLNSRETGSDPAPVLALGARFLSEAAELEVKAAPVAVEAA